MRLVSLLLALACVVPGIRAQTAGIQGLNDFTINGLFTGVTSCRVGVGVALSPVTFRISASATSTAAVVLLDVCRCTPNQAVFANACHPAGVTSLDIGTCGLAGLPLASVGGGVYTLTIPQLPLALRFSAQGIVLDPGCAPPFPLVLTQAFDVAT